MVRLFRVPKGTPVALHRCTEAFVLGAGDEADESASRPSRLDQNYVEDKVYDDRNKNVAAAIKRFPDRFTTESAR